MSERAVLGDVVLLGQFISGIFGSQDLFEITMSFVGGFEAEEVSDL